MCSALQDCILESFISLQEGNCIEQMVAASNNCSIILILPSRGCNPEFVPFFPLDVLKGQRIPRPKAKTVAFEKTCLLSGLRL